MNEEKKKYLSLYLLQNAKIHRLNEMIEKFPEDRAKFLKEIKAANLIRAEIEEKIERVDGGLLSELLFQKYICGQSLLKVSYVINYSPRQTERLHKKALEKFKI